MRYSAAVKYEITRYGLSVRRAECSFVLDSSATDEALDLEVRERAVRIAASAFLCPRTCVKITNVRIDEYGA
jgi:hypothetical protein